MPSRSYIARVAVTALGIWIGGVPGFCFGNDSSATSETPPLAADLQLDQADLHGAEALRQFAWGVYLQLASRGGFDEAAARYAEAVRLQPGSTVAFEHLVTPYLMQKRYDKVVELLAPLARENPAIPHLNIVYAEALQALQRDDEARVHLRRTLEAGDWSEPAVLRELFVALWRGKRYADAETLLNRARREPGLRGRFAVEHASAVFYSALKRTGAKDSISERRARRLTRQSIEHGRLAAARAEEAERPGDIESLANLLIDQGDPRTAAEMLSRLRTETGPDNPPPPEAILLEAKALQLTGRGDDAAALVDSLRKHAGMGFHVYPDMVELYSETGRLADAAAVYEDALTRFPNALPVRLQLAFLYLRLGEPRKGLAALLSLQQIPPTGRRLMAHLYSAMDQDDMALRTLQEAEQAAIAAHDDGFFTVELYLFGGGLCEDLGKADLAIEYGRKAVALAPDDPAACNFLGYILADHNQSLDEAERLIRRAVDAEPENDAYLDSLAWVCYRQKRFAEAQDAMNRALRIGMHDLDGVILDHAGDICAALELRELAAWYWRAAVRAKAPGAAAIEAKIRAQSR